MNARLFRRHALDFNPKIVLSSLFEKDWLFAIKGGAIIAIVKMGAATPLLAEVLDLCDAPRTDDVC